MMVNILKLREIFFIAKLLETSPRRLCNLWLDLAVAWTPDVQRVRYANADLFGQAQTGPRFRSYGYAFGHEPSRRPRSLTQNPAPSLCVLVLLQYPVQYPG